MAFFKEKNLSIVVQALHSSLFFFRTPWNRSCVFYEIVCSIKQWSVKKEGAHVFLLAGFEAYNLQLFWTMTYSFFAEFTDLLFCDPTLWGEPFSCFKLFLLHSLNSSVYFSGMLNSVALHKCNQSKHCWKWTLMIKC